MEGYAWPYVAAYGDGMATFPAQEGARHALEAERQIPEFDVYELPGRRWRAVHTADTSLVIEHSDWCELFMACVGVRIRRTIDQARDELMERNLLARDGHGRTRRL
jgi:hypothetical protein